MDSADAAPPSKAPPMPSEATATTTPSICNPKTAPKTPVSPQEPTVAAAAAAADAPTTTVTISKTLPSVNTSTTTKKRPLASTNQPAVKLVAPALKQKSNDKTLAAKVKKTVKKRKKKKFSSILSGMMKPKKELDVHAERESLRKTLGGGNFCKVDKI